jgi:hypothetical protein
MYKIRKHLFPHGRWVEVKEEWREYTCCNGTVVRVEKPVMLYVTSGAHRVIDAAGLSHYVPRGWVHLCWQASTGAPRFMELVEPSIHHI